MENKKCLKPPSSQKLRKILDVLESMKEIAGDLGKERTDETIHEYNHPSDVDCSHRNHCDGYDMCRLIKIGLYPNVYCSIPDSC